MEPGRAPAPDLFAALDWSARVAPDTSEAEAPPVPTNGAAHALPPEPAPATPPEPRRATPPEPRRATPPSVPELIEARTQGLPPAPSATPERATGSFSGLADLLEPDAEASPSLDEFDEMLEAFDEPGSGALTDEAPATARTEIAAPPQPASARTEAPLPQPRAPIEAARGGAPLPQPRAGEAARAARAPASPPRRPTPVMPKPVPVMPRPAAVSADAPTPIDFPAPGDAAESAQLHIPVPSSSLVSRVAPIVDDALDAEPRRGGVPWFWLALTLLLGGGLFWVLYTQTDLFSGDVIASRNAKAQAEAEAELAAQKQAAEAKKKEYGTIEIDSEPKGARVFDLRAGPEASFPALPIDHEYMVLVTAPGHLPRTRIVKGSELAAPVIVDLDPLPAGAAMPPLPEERVPKLAPTPSKQSETLVLRSNTKDATLGLLVGYTPGVKIIDVDVAQPQRYLVVLAGYEPQELAVKGRHFEEQGGNLVYFEKVTLTPAAPVPAAAADEGDEEDVVVDEDAPPTASAGTPPPPPTTAAAKPTPSKKKKKKRKKKRRR